MDHHRIFINAVRRAVPYLSYFVVGLTALMAVMFGVWLNQSEDVLVIKNQPVPAVVVAGYPPTGVVVLDVDYCKKTGSTGKIRTSFVSSTTEVFLPPQEDKQEATCRKVKIPHPIPPQVVPGKYHIHYRVTYNINPLKKDVLIEFDSKEFTLTSGGSGSQGVQGVQGIQGVQGEKGEPGTP